MKNELVRTELDKSFAGPGTSMKKHRRRVLIVEDDVELTTVLERVLRSIDPMIVTDWVTSAEQAIALLQEKLEGTPEQSARPPYDLILADIFLEGKATGIDLWRLCQEHLSKVPIVVTSGLPVDKFFSTIGQDAIAPPFLPKPFLLGECKQLLEGVLNYGGQQRH